MSYEKKLADDVAKLPIETQYDLENFYPELVNNDADYYAKRNAEACRKALRDTQRDPYASLADPNPFYPEH